MTEWKEAHSGKRIVKGLYVPNAGKMNGILIHRNIGTFMGKNVDRVEIFEVFQSKKGAWHVQCKGSQNVNKYGYPAVAGFPKETLKSVIDGLVEVYKEIYGDITVSLDELKAPVKKDKPPAKSDKLKTLEGLGF